MLKIFDITITVQGPLLTGSNSVGEFGVDSPIARNSDDFPYFAGSHVLGKVRQAIYDFKIPHVETIFGGQNKEEDDLSSKRRKVFFTDFTATNKGETTKTRTRIEINNKTGVVEQGALQVIEEPYFSGDDINFTGKLIVLATVDEKPLLKALQALVNLGGNRTVGYGKVTNVVSNPVSFKQEKIPEGTYFNYELKIIDPFLVGEKRLSKNTFTSSYFISGAVIKGALAQMNIIPGLENIVISQASPTKQNVALKPLPLSTFYYDEKGVQKDALKDGIIGLPKFQPDWKEQSPYSGSTPSKQLRVRTAIDRSKKSAKETALFAYEMVNVNEHTWCGTIFVPTASKVSFFATIENGIVGLGKTQNFATMTLTKAIKPEIKFIKDETVSLMLLTPALIRCDNEDYEKVFNSLFDNKLTLVKDKCFFQEVYKGGEFIAHKQGAVYKPYLLTTEGSVFTFVVNKDFKNDRFLKLRPEIMNQYNLKGNNWEKCIYLPENGFGEVELLS